MAFQSVEPAKNSSLWLREVYLHYQPDVFPNALRLRIRSICSHRRALHMSVKKEMSSFLLFSAVSAWDSGTLNTMIFFFLSLYLAYLFLAILLMFLVNLSLKPEHSSFPSRMFLSLPLKLESRMLAEKSVNFSFIIDSSWSSSSLASTVLSFLLNLVSHFLNGL